MFERVLAFWTAVWKREPIRAGGGSLTETDRRDLPRHPRTIEVFCRPVTPAPGTSPRWHAAVQDVSAGGIGLLLPQPVDIQTLLLIDWPRPIPSIPPTVTVRVLRVTPQPGGLWRLGCAFATDLSEPQLQSLLEALR